MIIPPRNPHAKTRVRAKARAKARTKLSSKSKAESTPQSTSMASAKPQTDSKALTPEEQLASAIQLLYDIVQTSGQEILIDPEARPSTKMVRPLRWSQPKPARRVGPRSGFPPLGHASDRGGCHLGRGGDGEAELRQAGDSVGCSVGLRSSLGVAQRPGLETCLPGTRGHDRHLGPTCEISVLKGRPADQKNRPPAPKSDNKTSFHRDRIHYSGDKISGIGPAPSNPPPPTGQQPEPK